MTDDILYRSTTLEISEENSDEWIFSGLAVPFNTITKIGDYRESFAPGAFSEVDPDLPIYFQHNHLRGEAPIGMITATEESEAGLRISAKISKTVRGTEIYQLLKDKVLRNFSIGFKPLAHKIIDDVVVRTKASLFEVSVVANPAYAGAVVTEVRQELSARSADEEKEKMTDSTNADLLEIRSGLEDLSREWDSLKSRITEGNKESEPLRFRSLGEFAKALQTGEATKADAEILTRAYTGANTGDLGTALKDSWVAKDVKFIQDRRPIWGLFNSEPLPKTGNNVEYPKVASTSGSVGVQAAEGDDLTYLEVVLGSATTPVKTVGGYSQLTRQVIERSDVNYLNKVLQFQKIQYSKTTNGLVRTALTGVASPNTGTIAFADKGKAITWTNAAIAGVGDIEANSYGLSADVWIMTLAQFKDVASIVDTTNRPVFDFTGKGSNVAGDVSVGGLRGNIAGIPVFVDPVLTGTYSYLVSRDSITTMEDGPWNLADENIINLSKAFSLYGYTAVGVTDNKGIVKINHPAS